MIQLEDILYNAKAHSSGGRMASLVAVSWPAGRQQLRAVVRRRFGRPVDLAIDGETEPGTTPDSSRFERTRTQLVNVQRRISSLMGIALLFAAASFAYRTPCRSIESGGRQFSADSEGFDAGGIRRERFHHRRGYDNGERI